MALNINGITQQQIVKLCFIDTETTGTKPDIHGIHQLSMIIVALDLKTGNRSLLEKVNLRMRPWNGCEYDEEALKVSNVSEEQISTYQPETEAFKQFRNVLDKHCNKFDKRDKYYFVGYNSQFDKDMCYAWFNRCGEKYFFSYFFSNHIDVMTLVTPMLFGIRPDMLNFKLGTVSKFLNIVTEDTSLHDAMYDIEITQVIFWQYYDNVVRKSEHTVSAPTDSDVAKLLQDNTPKMDFPFGAREKREKVIKRDTVITFGKYKGKTAEEIIEINASYLLWVEDNIADYVLSNELKEIVTATSEQQREQFRERMSQNKYRPYIDTNKR